LTSAFEEGVLNRAQDTLTRSCMLQLSSLTKASCWRPTTVGTHMKLFAEKRIRCNMMDVVEAYRGRAPRAQDVRREFFEVVRSLQKPELPVWENEPALVFRDQPLFTYLCSSGAFSETRKGAIKPLSHAKRKLAEKAFREGMVILAQSDLLDPCHLVIASVVVCDGSETDVESGSLYSNVGLIYLCLQDEWTPMMFAEHYLHEAVHNVLFIEDMVRGVFQHGERCWSNSAKVVSSIRQCERNFDLSFHAACVSVALAEFYLTAGLQRRATEFMAPLKITIRGLQKVAETQGRLNRSPLTPHGHLVLRELAADVNRIAQRLAKRL
jgi:hypothetical protein